MLLDINSKSLFCRDDVEDRYPNRPDELESVSLMYFVRNYDHATPTEIQKERQGLIKLQNNAGYMKPRCKAALINHPIPEKIKNPEEYFECYLLLFKPWRYRKDVLGSFRSYKDAFEAERVQNQEMVEYEQRVGSIADSQNNMEKQIKEEEKIIEDDIAPENL